MDEEPNENHKLLLLEEKGEIAFMGNEITINSVTSWQQTASDPIKQSDEAPLILAVGERGGQNTGATDAETSKENYAYLAHKLGKQVWFRTTIAAAIFPRVFQSYQNYTSLYHENPSQDIFNDSARVIYDPRKRITRAARRILLPHEFRHDRLTTEEQDALRARGMKNIARSSRLLILSNAGRLIGDGASVWECFGKNTQCNIKEATVAGFDAGVAGTWLAAEWYNKKGGSAIDAAVASEQTAKVEQKAYLLFRSGMYLLFVANLFQIVTGSEKMFIEVDNFIRDREQVSLSAFVDGAADAGRGGAYAVYNIYLLREAAKASKIGNTRGGTDILAVWSKVIPPRLLLSMRGLGMAGPAISTATSAYSVYDGFTNRALSKKQSRHQIISGSLGTTSSLFFLGGAFFITPASIPIGMALFCLGATFVAAQTFYDEWDEFFPMAEENASGSALGPLIGLGGGAVAVEGFNLWVGKGAGAKNIREAHQLGTHVLRKAIVNTPTRIRELAMTARNFMVAGSNLINRTKPILSRARSFVPQASLGAGVLAGGLATLKAGAAAVGTALTSSVAAAAGTVVVAGGALGAGIHYSGAGKHIGTDWLGEKTADVGIAITDWLFDVKRISTEK